VTTPHAEFDVWVRAQLAAVEDRLGLWVPADAPAGLGQAMRYGVLDGGKRLRPLLALAAAHAAGGSHQAALRAACAVELIHAYSLVHDDMPCMDNDVLRRGKPTVHVQFGQAQAMLAGDAMQALAFEVLTPDSDADMPPVLQARLCALLARAGRPALLRAVPSSAQGALAAARASGVRAMATAPEMTIRDALNSAIDEEMERDPTVFIIGARARRAAAAPFFVLAVFLFCFSRCRRQRRPSSSARRRGGRPVPGRVQDHARPAPKVRRRPRH
jgi:hypothetical protein